MPVCLNVTRGWHGLGFMRGSRRIGRVMGWRSAVSWRTASGCAAERGWRVVERYVDQDVSRLQRHERGPSTGGCLSDLRSGTIDGVIVYHLDRLHRQPRELEEFFDVCKAAGVDDARDA